MVRGISEQSSHLGNTVGIVVHLCPFRPRLTFILCAKMADLTLEAFHLHDEDGFRRLYRNASGHIHMVHSCRI